MQLTTEQLASAKAGLEDSKKLITWIDENSLTGSITAREVFQQLKEEYGQETIAPLIRALFSGMAGNRIESIVSRVVANRIRNVEDCDALIAKLNSSLAIVQAKKAELEG